MLEPKRVQVLTLLALTALLLTAPGCGLISLHPKTPNSILYSGGDESGEGSQARSAGEPASREAFLDLARRAVRDRESAIVVGEITYSADYFPRSTSYRFLVSEVIKPFRTDEGTYYIPTAANGVTPGESELRWGRRYVLIIRLELWYTRGQWIQGAHALSGSPGDIELLDTLRAGVEGHAKYGSGKWLSETLSWPTDVFGRRSPRPDGYLDPEAFRLGKSVVLEELADGGRLLLVRLRENRPADVGGQCFHVQVLEDLARGGSKSGEVIRVHLTKHYLDTLDWQRLPRPYHPSGPGGGYVHIVLLRQHEGEMPRLIAHLTPIGTDDATVREVRSWFRNEQQSVGPRPRPRK